MPNATPPSRYDLPWKIAITHAFRDFLHFFFPEIGNQVDWSKRPRFRDKELARIDLGDRPGPMVADMLVEVALRADPYRQVLIHVEVQAQRDTYLVQRVYDYNNRISHQYEQPVTSIVLLADNDPTWRPRGSHSELLEMTVDISFATAKLMDYANRVEELEASDNPIAWVTLAHLKTLQANHDPKKLYAGKLRLTHLLFQHDWNRKRIITLFNVLNWMMALPELCQRRFWRAVIQLRGGHKMKLLNPLEQMFVDDGRKIGRQEGLKEGRAEGRKDGAVALLERQLARRFGPLSKTTRDKLAKASMSQLETWSDALPEAQSLRQVFGPKSH